MMTTVSADPLTDRFRLEIHHGTRYVLPAVAELPEAFAWWAALPVATRSTLTLAVRCTTQGEINTAGRALLSRKSPVLGVPLALLLAPAEPLDLLRCVGRASYRGCIPGVCVDIDGGTWHREDAFCDSCGWGYPNDPLLPNPRLTRVVITGETIVEPWLRAIERQCAAGAIPVEVETGAVLVPPPVKAPEPPGPPPARRPDSTCADPDCTLSDGLAHGGECEPCACGELHAIDECPKNPTAAYPRCVRCGAWEDDPPERRFLPGRRIHAECAS